MSLPQFVEALERRELLPYQRELLKKIEEASKDGRVLILWPRRTGKASVLRAIEQAKAEGSKSTS